MLSQKSDFLNLLGYLNFLEGTLSIEIFPLLLEFLQHSSSSLFRKK